MPLSSMQIGRSGRFQVHKIANDDPAQKVFHAREFLTKDHMIHLSSMITSDSALSGKRKVQLSS